MNLEKEKNITDFHSLDFSKDKKINLSLIINVLLSVIMSSFMIFILMQNMPLLTSLPTSSTQEEREEQSKLIQVNIEKLHDLGDSIMIVKEISLEQKIRINQEIDKVSASILSYEKNGYEKKLLLMKSLVIQLDSLIYSKENLEITNFYKENSQNEDFKKYIKNQDSNGIWNNYFAGLYGEKPSLQVYIHDGSFKNKINEKDIDKMFEEILKKRNIL